VGGQVTELEFFQQNGIKFRNGFTEDGNIGDSGPWITAFVKKCTTFNFAFA
jgi:hypothetical protein